MSGNYWFIACIENRITKSYGIEDIAEGIRQVKSYASYLDLTGKIGYAELRIPYGIIIYRIIVNGD